MVTCLKISHISAIIDLSQRRLHVEAIQDEESNSDSDEEEGLIDEGSDGILGIEKDVLYALNLAGHVSNA